MIDNVNRRKTPRSGVAKQAVPQTAKGPVGICRRALIFALTLSALLAAGCSATVIPPAHPAPPVTVVLTDYGRHSSLLLPAGDGGMIEYAYGDWDWFVLGQTGPFNAIRALFFSPSAALGRRRLNVHPAQPDLIHVLGCERAIIFDVSREQAQTLTRQLEDRYNQHLETLTYRGDDVELYFVADDKTYRLWHNCNHETAHWLRELGCQIHGEPMLSSFKVRTENSVASP